MIGCGPGWWPRLCRFIQGQTPSLRAITEGAGPKRYRLTAEGEAFLTANRPAVDALLARLSSGSVASDGVLAPVLRGMGNLKLALRLRLRQSLLDQDAAQAIAAALDAAAQTWPPSIGPCLSQAQQIEPWTPNTIRNC